MSELQTHHVGVTVAELDRAVEFYCDVFELSIAATFEVSGDAFATGVDIDGASARFAHLDGGSVRIELVEYDPAGDEQPAPRLNAAGATHIGLQIEDLDAFYNELPATVETLSPPQTTATGTRILFVRDPEDNLIEVLEVST